MNARIALALLAIWTIWSSTYFALRIVVQEAPAMLSSGLRFALAGIALFLIGFVRGEARPTGRELLRAAPAGIFLFAGGNGLLALAERTASSGAGALGCALAPVWAALLSLFWGERPTGRQWIAFLLGFAGVAVLCSGGALPDRSAATLLIFAPVCWATGTVLARRYPSRASLQLVMGGASMLLFGFVTGEHVPHSIGAPAILAWVYLVVFGSMVGFTAYAYLVRRSSTTVAMSYAYVNPILAVLLGAALGGEHVGKEIILSGALVVAAVLAIVMRRSAAPARRPRPDDAPGGERLARG
jgi:drug/metabolite transporter (DMT)-like permease